MIDNTTSTEEKGAPPQTDEQKAEVARHLARHELLVGQRKTYETHWQECFDFIVPRKNDVTVQHTPGGKRGNNLFDTTAIMANTMLAGQLHSRLTNPTVRFFDLVMSDPKLMDDDDVREWLADTADRMFKILNNTNFQTEVHEIYIDEGAIGNACLFMGEHKEKILHFSARAMKEIYVDENNLGLIDTVHRVFKWKLRQLIQEFGEDAIPKDLLRKKNEDDQIYEVLHITNPMTDEEKTGKGAFEFNSLYILKEKSFKLSQRNFHEFPYAVPRWTKTSGEIYGRGPGMDMLPDIRMVNKMMETVLKGAQKTVDPPLMVSDDGVIGQVKLTPGGLTVVRPFSGNDVPIRPLITNANVEFGQKIVQDTRERIRQGYYIDQLLQGPGDRATTAEVNQVDEQRMSLMGPILGRQHFEFLSPLITRTFGVGNRRGLFAPAPASIQGKPFEPRYSSLVARAQRMSEGTNLGRALQVAGPFFQLDPKSAQVIDADQGVKQIMEIYGVNPKIVRNKRDLDKIRAQEQQASQQLAQRQQEQHQAQIAGQVLPAVAQLQTAKAASSKA